jgi:hypothetical protein
MILYRSSSDPRRGPCSAGTDSVADPAGTAAARAGHSGPVIRSPLLRRSHQHLRDLAADAACRVIVRTGAGCGFCAGLDLDGFGTLPGTEDYGRTHRTWSVQRAIAGLG